ncbi:metallophosphoesterase [Pseudomonas fulva]|uniref:metallophosphoesterase n=1 Tax=Pseudomonas fulva TaxID=47880 RepID=UPI0038515DD0
MKVLIYSDLHIEFKPFDPPDVEADLVVLAGDIGIQAKGVLWANQAFQCQVIYCAGNHEHYKGHLNRTVEKMRAAAAPHVHILENESMTIGGVRFLAATAWTDFSSTGDVAAASRTCAREMNDFRMIRADENYRRLRPGDLVFKNLTTKAFLGRELSQQFDGKTFVITHHSPLPEVSGDEEGGHVSAAYYNRWHGLVEQADFWAFGHTHHSVDRMLGGCRLISNQRGYPGESCGFDPEKIIEIE